MSAAEVKIALRRNISDVDGDPTLLAQLVNVCRCYGIIDSRQHHDKGRVIEIAGFEKAVDVRYALVGCDAVRDFGVEARGRAYDSNKSIGIEEIVYATCCYLYLESTLSSIAL